MMERNKDLTRQNQILNREVTFLTKELQEETAAKETQKQEMEKAANEMKMTIQQQASNIVVLEAENSRILNEQKLHLKNSDMMRNIKLLNDAFAAKKIPNETHKVKNVCFFYVLPRTGSHTPENYFSKRKNITPV